MFFLAQSLAGARLAEDFRVFRGLVNLHLNLEAPGVPRWGCSAGEGAVGILAGTFPKYLGA